MLSIAKPSLYKPSSKSTVSQKPKEVIIEERVTTKNALGGKDNQVIRYRRGKLLGKVRQLKLIDNAKREVLQNVMNFIISLLVN